LIDGVTARPEPWRREPDPSDHTVLRDIHIQTIIDLRRAVDVLVARPDVDAERIGFAGVSYGAILGGVLAGVDHRIGAFLLVSGYPRFIETLPLDLRQEAYAQAMDPVDPIHYIGHAAPSTLFFQFGRFDSTMLPMAPLEYFDAASEPKEVRWYDAGHGLNSQAYYDRGEWLATQLGLDPSPLESISVED
jgi:poly(3-hydroxybutyrate) depolymerase